MSTKRTKPDDDTTDYMKLRIIISEVCYNDDEEDDDGEWHYSSRGHTAHVKIVRDEEKSINMNARGHLDRVTNKAELVMDTFLFKALTSDGYWHWAQTDYDNKSTEQWTLIKLE